MRAWKFLLVLPALALTHIAASVGCAAEIGIDAGASLQVVDKDTRNIIGFGLPASESLGIFSVQSVRAGFPVSGSGEIQPALGLSILSEEEFSGDRNTLTHIFLSLSYLQGLKPTSRTGPYLRGGADFRVLAITNQPARTQPGIATAFGYRWRPGRVIGVRVEAGTARWFETEHLAGHWDLGLRAGISAYTD